jgi:hypothetical protein
VSRISKEAEQEKRLEAEKLEREVFLNDVRHVLSSVQGRRFVWRILDMAGVYRSSFTGNSTTFFNEGARNIGLRVLSDVMDAKPEAFLLMQQEDKKRKERKSNGK